MYFGLFAGVLCTLVPVAFVVTSCVVLRIKFVVSCWLNVGMMGFVYILILMVDFTSCWLYLVV